MPNYVINAVYQPFSFQERLAPLQMMKEEYDTVGANLTQLGDEANAWQQYINPQSRSGQKLAAYNANLAKAAEDLSKNGLRAVGRNTLYGLRRTYTQDISKINKAAQTLAGMYDQYRNMSAKDQTLMIGQMPDVDTLVDNPGASPLLVSGNQLYAQGNAAAKAASGRKTSTSVALDNAIRGYFHIVQTTGYDSAETAQFLADASSIPELQAAMDQIRQMYKTDGLDNPAQADQYILRGILDGMAFNRKEDWKYDQMGAEERSYQRQLSLQRERQRAAAQQAAMAQGNSSLPLFKRNIYTQNERTEDAKVINGLNKFFIQGADGSFQLNDAGRRALRDASNDMNAYVGPYSRGEYHLQPELENFMRKNNIKAGDAQSLEQAFNAFYAKHNNELFDASRASEYAYRVDPSDQGIWMDNLRSLANDGILYTAEFDPKSGQYQDGKKVKISNLKNATFLSFNASSYGTTADILTKGGERMTIRMRGYNPSVDALIQEGLTNISTGEQRIARTIQAMGLNPDEVGDPRQLLNYLAQQAQMGNQNAAYWYQYLYQELANYQQDQSGLMSAMSQYGNTNTNKPTEFAGFDF